MTGLQKHTSAPHQKDLEAKKPGKSGTKYEKLIFSVWGIFFLMGHDTILLIAIQTQIEALCCGQ